MGSETGCYHRMGELKVKRSDTPPARIAKEPKTFERGGPFTIDYQRCYVGFGTAVTYEGAECIVVCPTYEGLEKMVQGPLRARIEAGFHRVVVAPETKVTPLAPSDKAPASETDTKYDRVFKAVMDLTDAADQLSCIPEGPERDALQAAIDEAKA